MNIGIVCYPTFGGSGVVATELGIALANEGHKVHFVTYSQPRRLEFYGENIYYHEVSIFNYPLFEYPPYELALASKLVEVAILEKLDILHVHYAIPHASVAFLAKQILLKKGINMPFITTLHGTDITLVAKESEYESVISFSINESDGVTSVSESLKKETLELLNINKEINVIPNFIDFTRFSRQKKDHFKKAICPHNEKLIIHTSNFRKVKRIQDVIIAFCEIKNKIPSKLLLVGDGPERSEAEKTIKDLNCNCDDIRFLGKIEAIEEVLSVGDLFLMPSEKESFGLAALEAMACKVPVVSSNIGGLPELNIDGVSGYLCNVGDTHQMAQKSIEILENETTLEKFKEAAFNRAKDFDLKLILPKYESLYLSVLNRK